MLRKALRRLEDPDQPLLGPNIWILKLTGLLVSDNPRVRWFHSVMQVLVNIFIVTQFIEAWFVLHDKNLFLNNISILGMSTLCGLKVNSCLIWQKKWRNILNYITEADLEERGHQDLHRKTIVERYTKYSRTVSLYYWIYAYTTALILVVTPVFTYVFTPGYRRKLRDVTTPFPHILSAWVPFDKNSAPGCWIVVIWQIVICCYGGSIQVSYDSAVIVIMTFFEKKLELLQRQCSLICTTECGFLSDEEFRRRIKECHRIYMRLMKYAKIFNAVLSPVMFLFVLLCSIYLGAGAMLFVIENNTVAKILNIEYLTFAVTQLFVYCWHSNNVLYQSTKMSFGAYDSKWWSSRMDVSKKRLTLLLSGTLSQRLVFTAGPFTDLQLSTFIKILKGAYSYYTLLRK